MDINVHDLLRVDCSSELISEIAIPDWVHGAVQRMRWVVVRRAAIHKGLIPIGVRGKFRHERFAAYLSYSSILEVKAPTQLVEHINLYTNSRKNIIPALSMIENIASYYSEVGVSWGPTGSIGFELASGYPVVHSGSDIDIAIFTPHPVEREIAADWDHFNQSFSFQIDALLETPQGACSLIEYVHATDRLLLRTKERPQMVRSPWNAET